MLEVNRRNLRIWSMLGMRRIVGIILKDLAESDNRFLFATADLGRYFGNQDLAAHYPEKVVDIGIAEQNLIGVSAGLQNEGFHVWAATYATFITARALDQIRVNMGLMGLGIKLIGAAGGLADGNFSATHMALEDICNMCAIPNMTVIVPADGLELVKTIESLGSFEGPAYVRLTGRAGIPTIYKEDYDFQIGKAICLKDGHDVAIISSGTILGTVLAVSRKLEDGGISCKVINMHTVKPLDTAALDELSDFKLVVTVEEHMKFGGLGSAVSEYYAEQIKKPVVQLIAVENFYPEAAEYEDLLDICGLTEEKILSRVVNKYNEIIFSKKKQTRVKDKR